MKTAIYSRKSRASEKGESIQNQIDMCKQYAKLNFTTGESAFEVYADEGFSGGTTNRPAFNRLLNDIKSGEISALICYRLDRISRSVMDFSEILEELNSRNITFVSVTERFDTSTPVGRAMLYIASVFAQLERETITERIRDNLAKLARSERWLNGKPAFGFKTEKQSFVDESGNKRNFTKLIHDEQALETIRLIFDKYLELRSLGKLSLYLEEKRIFTNRNSNFAVTPLKHILENPVYVISDESIYTYFSELGCDIASAKEDFNGNGLLIHRKYSFGKGANKKQKVNDFKYWIIAIGTHKGIISSKTWLETQSIIKYNADKAPRESTSKVSLISSVLRCSECGGKMGVTYRTNKNEENYYYRCHTKARSRGKKCSIKNLDGKEADTEIIKQLSAYAEMNTDKFISLLKLPKTLSEHDRAAIIEHEISELTTQIHNLTLMLSKNQTAEKYVFAQIEQLDTQLNKKQSELKNIKALSENLKATEQREKELLQKLSYFNDNFVTLTPETRQLYIKDLLKAVYWNGESLSIEFNL
ncbi:MAG: recombinase family protein [Clostridiales bacterium]|jgi:site-specific DNA recombinase|nr:recombinase family protein [Clostridiales bacterium]